MTSPSTRSLIDILTGILAERLRQDDLKSSGRFAFTCADDGLTNAEKLAILTEEIGEVARQVLTQPGGRLTYDSSGSPEDLRKELVQVAAVAIAWIESLTVESLTKECP